MPYHPQTNGLVERLHQTIMYMIGKLGEDKKADWPSHLAEIVHAYNATWSTVTGYSPHYLMFRWEPRLPVDFCLPHHWQQWGPMREASAKSVDMYMASIKDRLRSALWEVQVQSTVEMWQQKQYYDRKIGAVNLKPGDLVLVKADAWKGKRKIKDRWEEETLGGGASNCSWHPLLWSDQLIQMVMSPPLKLTSCHIKDWHSLVYGQPSYTGQVYQSHPMQDYLYRRWKREDATREKWEGSHLMTYQ